MAWLVCLGEVIEIAPATLVLLSIRELVLGEILHSVNIFEHFSFLEIRNGYFSKVYSQEAFDLIPVGNVSFSLLNIGEDLHLLLVLSTGGLEECFHTKFILVQFFAEFSLLSELLNSLLFAVITGFFFSNCSNKCSQVEHLTLHPVSDVHEWIGELLSKFIQFISQVSFGIS